jgi:hypothetical protein
MRVSKILFLTLILFESCYQPSSDSLPVSKEYAQLKFDSDFYDFGMIKNGDTVYHTFKFKNTGTVPLKIEDISTTCGCTAAEWPKSPVDPEKTGEIKIQFTKNHDPGVHDRSIIVKANTLDPYTVLKFTATVKN